MNKSDILKKRKWLKARRRANKMRKHHNYTIKTLHRTSMPIDNIIDENVRANKEKVIK